ncbi:hypothetical protein NOK12_29900 [Nocardioides sp. OK12]|uniref:hypothetical protein n=1 Tax=Nocardioides sp. OK12 TaxID=2758661 RepID=UPI0021C2C049|nr:hypothetical protein [Nocardioides sp. OK12]GHJ60472.1 hypothetical protein NOK12_29900 [Nocardioides sp. OK12]
MSESTLNLPDGFGSWSRRVVVATLIYAPLFVIFAWVIEHWTSSDLGLLVALGPPMILTAPWVFESTRARDPDRAWRHKRAASFLFLLVVVSSLAWIGFYEEGAYRWLSAMGLGLALLIVLRRQWVQDWMRS